MENMEAVLRLRKHVPPGTKLFTIRHHAANEIRVLMISGDEIEELTPACAIVGGFRVTPRCEAIPVRGTGHNHGAHVVDIIAGALGYKLVHRDLK